MTRDKTINFEDRTINGPRLFGAIILVLFLLITAWNSFYVANAGERAVVFNKAGGGLREADEGLHFKVPYFETVTKYETRGQLYKTVAEGASRDLQIVTAEVAVLYHPQLDQIATLHLRVGPSYAERVIAPSVSETVKATTAQYNAVELIERRAAVKLQIADNLTRALAEHDLVVESVSITNFDFSAEFNAAIESKVVAQQEAERANNTLLRVRYEAQQKVIYSEANLTAANFSAQETIIRAQANATAIQIVRDQVGGADAFLQWMRLQQWNGILPQTLVTDGNTNSTSILVGLP